jgi:toxin ParE1/3/4
MRRIRLHARAESDLIDIWLYSFEEWDDVQADKYLDELNAAIKSLAANPQMGARRDNVRDGYRALFSSTVTQSTIDRARQLRRCARTSWTDGS